MLRKLKADGVIEESDIHEKQKPYLKQRRVSRTHGSGSINDGR